MFGKVKSIGKSKAPQSRVGSILPTNRLLDTLFVYLLAQKYACLDPSLHIAKNTSSIIMPAMRDKKILLGLVSQLDVFEAESLFLLILFKTPYQ